MFSSNMHNLLNTHSPTLRNSMSASIKSSISTTQLQDIKVSSHDAISNLKNGKSDSLGLFSEHLRYAGPVIAGDLAIFFTACFRHGYLPQCIRDYVVVPVPKSGKDQSSSTNYRPITLAST